MGGFQVLVSSIVPAYPTINVRTATVTAKTADYTVTVADLKLPTIFTNTGDDGTQVLTLPTIASSRGRVIRAAVLAAQIIRIDPSGTEKINLNGSAVAGKYLNIAAVIGNYAELFNDGTQWIVTSYAGVVTKEA